MCPAPCEAACTLNINNDPVGIKSIEHFIIDKGWEEGWVAPQTAAAQDGPPRGRGGLRPRRASPARSSSRAPATTSCVFEKADRIGGLLRYGIPDFKMEKHLIDRRMAQMAEEGVEFRPNAHVGGNVPARELHGRVRRDRADRRRRGAARPAGARAATSTASTSRWSSCRSRTRSSRATRWPEQIKATGKHVVVIGGGDTGSDCVGTSNRHGAASVTQFELLPQPPDAENKPLVWPNWPIKLRTSSSHEEGCERDWSVTTKRFEGRDGKVGKLVAARVEWQRDGNGAMKMVEVPGSEFELPADLVLFAMGFVGPVQSGLLEQFGVERDARSNVKADTETYRTSVPKVFAAGDMRRGQSLVVWAIREGRQAARAVDEFLMGVALHAAAMTEVARPLDIEGWQPGAAAGGVQEAAVRALEGGGVVRAAARDVRRWRSASGASSRRAWSDGRAKNVSLDGTRLKGAQGEEGDLAELAAMVARFAAERGVPRHHAVPALRAVRQARAHELSPAAAQWAATSRGARTIRGCTSTPFPRGPITASASCACSPTSTPASRACGGWASRSRTWRGPCCRASGRRCPASPPCSPRCG